MTWKRIRFILLLIFKIIVATVVMILLLAKTEIEREELAWKPRNFNMTFKSISYSGNHLFCPFPDARAMTVNESDLFLALNLPAETQIDSELRNYGECRAKVQRLKESVDLCNCQPRVLLIVVVVVAIVSICTSFMHFCCGPWKPDNNCAFFSFFEGISWLVLASAATFSEVLSHETMTLSNNGTSTMQEQRYFKPVVNWWVAFAMSYLYTVLALMEGVCYLKFSSKQASGPKEASKEAEQIVSSQSAVEEAVHLHEITSQRPEKWEEKELLHLMAIRESIQPRSIVVTLGCKTYP